MNTKIGNENARASTQWLPLADLSIDPVVQRAFRQSWADAIAREFDPDKLGVIHVSKRTNGQHVVIDGQHRRAAVVKFLGDDANGQRLECKVYEGLSRADEAALFLGLNRFRRPTRIDEFQKGVTAKEPICVAIHKIVEDVGFRVDATNPSGENVISAVGALENVYLGCTVTASTAREKRGTATHYPNLLRDTLKVMREAWGGTHDGCAGLLIEGIGRVLAARQRAMDLSEFVRKLAKYPGGPSAIIGAAKGLKALNGTRASFAMADVLIELYNRGRRVGRLDPLR